jgi:hypothetical protein
MQQMVPSTLKRAMPQDRLSNGFFFGSPAFRGAKLYDGRACVGLLALSSFCRISKLQNLNGDERFDSRRLHHYLFYYQCFAC